MARDPRDFVCFAKSFAYERAPNITHMTLDGERTACGRKGCHPSPDTHGSELSATERAHVEATLAAFAAEPIQ